MSLILWLGPRVGAVQLAFHRPCAWLEVARSHSSEGCPVEAAGGPVVRPQMGGVAWPLAALEARAAAPWS
eukprot:2934544-Pyramimonas_sp.AAC.1